MYYIFNQKYFYSKLDLTFIYFHSTKYCPRPESVPLNVKIYFKLCNWYLHPPISKVSLEEFIFTIANHPCFLGRTFPLFTIPRIGSTTCSVGVARMILRTVGTGESVTTIARTQKKSPGLCVVI